VFTRLDHFSVGVPPAFSLKPYLFLRVVVEILDCFSSGQFYLSQRCTPLLCPEAGAFPLRGHFSSLRLQVRGVDFTARRGALKPPRKPPLSEPVRGLGCFSPVLIEYFPLSSFVLGIDVDPLFFFYCFFFFFPP